MDYTEAVKKVKAEKPKENFMVFSFDSSYNKRILLPYKDGAALLVLLANAELLDDRYGEPKRIVELERDTCVISAFSHQEYERYKIAALLNISPDEVKIAAEQATKAK